MNDHELARSAREYALPVDTTIAHSLTIEEAISTLRNKKIHQKIIYFYAVDEQHRLKGVVSTRQLLLADPKTKIEDVCQSDVVKIEAHQTLKEVMEIFNEHSLLAIPVIDAEGKLLGAIDVQMVTQENIDFANEKARYDVFQMIGITLEERKKTPLLKSYSHRMPWLLCNVFSGLMCAVISRCFEIVLSEFIVLAFFIPLVLTLSESTSMQSMAQSLQILRRPRFSWKAIRLRSWREWQLVWLLALTLGVIVGLFSLLWKDGWGPSIAIGVGIIGGVSFSSLFGIFVPIGLNRLKLDPKVASGPVVLMVVDVLTTAVYLGLATWWLV